MPLRESTKKPAIANISGSIQGERRPLLFARDVGRIDSEAARLGVAGTTLMAAAGTAVARQRQAIGAAPAGPTLVLAGPGKNGGDGYVAARVLAADGVPTTVLEIPTERRASDADQARQAWLDGGGAVTTMTPQSLIAALEAAPAVIIDALFGVGLARPLAGVAAEAAALVADRRRTLAAPPVVIAVDIPSGVSADTGIAPGPAFEADLTVTFVARKPGHFLADGARLSGAVVTADIGMPEAAWAVVDPVAYAIARPLWRRSLDKAADGHKYAHGSVMIAAGGFGATGAARLAALGALRIGAGLVTVLAPEAAMAECAAQLTAVMLREAETPDAFRAHLADRRVSAVALGMGHAAHPGGLARTRAFVEAALADGAARLTVLDADALTAFADAPTALFDAVAGRPVAMTPHSGEFARLFPDLARRLGDDADYGKLAATRDAAARAGAVVLLKGVDTVVAAPDGRCGLQAATGPRAAPWLATAGSGDVLAGLIAGLGARGFGAFEAACAGAWAHLEAGRRAGPGAIAEDLPDAIRSVLADAIAGAQEA